jgi:hypothetical protein
MAYENEPRARWTTWLFLVWYLPLAIFVLLAVVVPSGAASLQNIRTIWHHFSLPMLWSPSADFCWFLIVLSVTFPLTQLWLIAYIMVERQLSLRWRYALAGALTALIFVSSILIQILIWGSFPFEYDAQGFGRVRMIPFYPWPTEPFPLW